MSGRNVGFKPGIVACVPCGARDVAGVLFELAEGFGTFGACWTCVEFMERIRVSRLGTGEAGRSSSESPAAASTGEEDKTPVERPASNNSGRSARKLHGEGE